MNDNAINVCNNNYPRYISVARKYLGSLEDAEDCVQEAFLKVIRYKGTFNNVGSLEGWIKRIVINTAIDSYRRRRTNKVTYDTDLVDRYDYAEEEEKPYMEDIPNQLVIDAIESLSPSYQKVAKMYLLDGYKHHEISEVLNISLGTSKSNLSKGKKNVINYIRNHII
jgi:RNA polymerase sigma factor (sigma-70 family)